MKIERLIFTALILMLAGCVPESIHYYAPVDKGLAHTSMPCGGPEIAEKIDRSGINAAFMIDLPGSWEYLKTQSSKSITFIENFEMPAGTSMKFFSDTVLVYIDDAPEPIKAHVATPSYCHSDDCIVPIGSEIQGHTGPVKQYDGNVGVYNKYLVAEVVLEGLVELPRKLRFVLPPTSFNGQEAEVITLSFRQDSGIYFMALNGC